MNGEFPPPSVVREDDVGFREWVLEPLATGKTRLWCVLGVPFHRERGRVPCDVGRRNHFYAVVC